MSKTNSCSRSSATTCPSFTHQKTDHERFMERELRLIDANPIHSLSRNALDGAVFVPCQVGDVLEEYQDVIDVCCEKQLVPPLSLEEGVGA